MRLIYSCFLSLLFSVGCSQNSEIVLKEFEEIHCTTEDLIAATGDSINIRITDGEYSKFSRVRIEDLTSLVLNDTEATEIPETIGKLKNLEILSLSWGKYTTIPEEIYNLPKLKNLIIFSTAIKELPPEFFKIKTLKHLSIIFNPDFSFQKELCEFNFHISLIDYGTKTNIPKCLLESGKIKVVKSKN